MTIKQVRRGTLFAFLVLVTASCGGGSSSEEEDVASEDANALAVAFPDDLAVSSPTASTESSGALQATLMAGINKLQEVFAPETFVGKKEDLDGLLNPGEGDAFVSKLGEIGDDINIFRPAPTAACYGPTLDYAGHPNAGAEPNSGELPSGDLGIWTASEASGEACCAAKMNNIIGQFEALINAGTKTVAATLGAASLEPTLADLPPLGESLDMTAKADEVMTENDVPIDFSTAVLERLPEDTADGDPIFQTTIEGTFALEDGTIDMEATLEHIPMGELPAALKSQDSGAIADGTYCGRLTQAVNIPAAELGGGLGNCGGSDGITRCTAVEYCKESATSLTYHLRTGEYCGMDKDCGTVDPADKKTGDNPDGWGNNFYYTVCNVNPEDGTGDCAQAWQAGALDGNTRVLNVTVGDDDSGTCYFGYGPDVAASSDVGSIDRMICNWAGPGNNHTGVAKAQRQTFSRNADGVFVADTSNITYAPTNSCDKTTDPAFSYDGVAAGVAVTNNLISLDDVDFTVPTLPVIPE